MRNLLAKSNPFQRSPRIRHFGHGSGWRVRAKVRRTETGDRRPESGVRGFPDSGWCFAGLFCCSRATGVGAQMDFISFCFISICKWNL